ncbi:MAG: chemotaxis protein CheW [Myxococcales bacterium]
MAEQTASQASPKPLMEALAQAKAVNASQKIAEIELFRIEIAGTAFAVEAGLVQEVVRTPPITPLPGAPPFLVGVASHRGDVVAIVDLARLLGRGETQVRERSRLAIARSEGMVVGLLADEVLGLVKLPSASIQPPPLGTEDKEFISGVITAPETMHLLDLRRALATARERASARR